MVAKNNKSLGQHWLKNREILEEIAEGSAVAIAETCVEIGPGLGTLTSSLLKRFKKVVAVEFDERLAENLPKSFPGKNLEVINDDILQFDFSKIKEPYVVVGNIPYYITSPIIEKVLSVENLPEKVVLLMQKEVAERILDEKESGLSLFVKNRADVEPGILVPKEEFTPPPKVDSAVLIMTPHAPKYGDELFNFIRLAFIAPRKKLIHNLAPLKSKEELVKIFDELSIGVDSRPADLHLDTYFALFSAII